MRLAIPPILISSLLLIFLNACQSREGLLTKVWIFDYEKTPRAEGRTDPELNEISFLNLQPEGKYTANFGGFEYGKWFLDDKVLTLHTAGAKPRKLLLVSLTDKSCVLDLNPADKYISHSIFHGYEDLDEEESPFSIQNNKWRMKASQKESAQQITDRLVNHFRYWETYFKWGLEVDRNSLDVRSHPTPLKLYGNGFALMPVSNWPEEWSRNFYDDDDRQVAFSKIRWTLRNRSVKWPESGHKFKQFMSAFQQMQTNVRLAK